MTRNAELYIYTPELEEAASRVLESAIRKGARIVTAESCTGGALAALLTDVEGLSRVFDRGFAVYCDDAKSECLGVSRALLEAEGAVSKSVAEAMATGALHRSTADVAIAITGNAGPAGPNAEEGLVFVASAVRGGAVRTVECHFGAAGRAAVRIRALESALQLLAWGVDQ